jgi:hypothetical protein
MRDKTTSFAGKELRIEEKKIGELEKIVAELFPESKGDLSKIKVEKLLEQAGFDLLYKKLPVLIPEITEDDVKNAYMSELEALIEVFIEVNFSGVKRLVKPLLGLIQAGLPQK